VDADPEGGNGFSFATYDAAEFRRTLDRAMKRFAAGGAAWRALVVGVMREDHSWRASAERYVRLYRRAVRSRRG
jgi:starch synthase